jgi:hypothetical protein
MEEVGSVSRGVLCAEMLMQRAVQGGRHCSNCTWSRSGIKSTGKIAIGTVSGLHDIGRSGDDAQGAGFAVRLGVMSIHRLLKLSGGAQVISMSAC